MTLCVEILRCAENDTVLCGVDERIEREIRSGADRLRRRSLQREKSAGLKARRYG